MVSEIINFASLIVVSIIGGLFTLESQRNIKDRKKIEDRAKIRGRESLLSMNMHHATINLAILNAKALTNQKLNGDVREAMESATKAKIAYEEFLNEISANTIVKI